MPTAVGLEFSSVTISFLMHATEDEEILLGSVYTSFGISEDDLTREALEGYYGNMITHIKAHLIGSRATEISRMILSGLDEVSKGTLLAELERYLDEHDALYVRLDRQELLERFHLGDDDPVSIKLKPKFRPRDRNAMNKAYHELIQA